MEKFAVEIRNLQKTETREVEEAFAKGQKGSSAMPHKRNPIGSENITGLSRVIRGYITTAYENFTFFCRTNYVTRCNDCIRLCFK